MDTTNLETAANENTTESGTDDIEVAQETLENQNFDEIADGDRESKTGLEFQEFLLVNLFLLNF